MTSCARTAFRVSGEKCGLVDARFGAGTAGADHLEGNFHGSAHEEGLGGVRHRGPCRRVRGEAGAVTARQGVSGLRRCDRSTMPIRSGRSARSVSASDPQERPASRADPMHPA